MSAGLPKLDKRALDGIARLKNQADFQLLVKHYAALYDYIKDCLVTAQPADVPTLQGQARQLREFLDNVK